MLKLCGRNLMTFAMEDHEDSRRLWYFQTGGKDLPVICNTRHIPLLPNVSYRCQAVEFMVTVGVVVVQ